MIIRGEFDVKMQGEPPFDVVDGVTLMRASFDKRFHGALEATSQVWMLASRTPVEGSGMYVAMERVKGTLEGREGTFALAHMGTMTRGAKELVVRVVPDSGTGALAGIAGQMQIDIVEGKHFYTFDYALEPR